MEISFSVRSAGQSLTGRGVFEMPACVVNHPLGTPLGVETAEQVSEPASWQRPRQGVVDEYAK